ncbi:TetR/AcrR family transcriptional regulator [Nocardia sp. NPDC059240]|uniref:TetR/AcrR family transcriptional regulator n=1 Tax=Nocardia sp. NPDC059240 TaxID=3346786 RepID=UPI00367BB904
MTDPRAGINDLTTKARIRNAALDLYAEQGEDRVSMRTVAAAAGVAVGLVQHHFKTKDGLRDAVERLIVDYHAQAIAQVPDDGSPGDVAAARDAAVRAMLETHPTVVNYLRRALLDPKGNGGRLLTRLTELTRVEIARLRGAGLASTSRPESAQVIGLMVRQVGHLFLQPMVDAMWEQLTEPGTPPEGKPELSVTIRDPSPRPA